MKIVMFSINPLFEGQVMGGAPKHLQNIAIHMGKLGHEVVVVCTRRSADQMPFEWGENVAVKPVLPFKQPFPQPYATPAYNLAAAVQLVAEELETADRFYMHDGEFLFPYAYRHVPTVTSLRDNVYPETLLGGFLFQGHKLILISDYARQYFEQTVGRFFPELPQRIQVVRNGLDWEKFKPVQPRSILDIIPVNPAHDMIVLHPHRPEESKGIRQTIEVVDYLVNRFHLKQVKALVPRWLDLDISDDLRGFYNSIHTEIATRGLTEHFVFHNWIPHGLMPEYYSLGHVTLALGNFVESFGNAVYESLGCGTPTVVSRVSSHRELLPEHLIDKVDFGDTGTAAQIAADILIQRRRTSPETMAYLHEHYSTARQLDGYAQAILNAEPIDDLRYQFTPISEATRFKMPVWCYRSPRGIYHDFRGDYLSSDGLLRLTDMHPDGFTQADAAEIGVDGETVLGWYRDGYLYPVTQL